jgi:hypothetical protein
MKQRSEDPDVYDGALKIEANKANQLDEYAKRIINLEYYLYTKLRVCPPSSHRKLSNNRTTAENIQIY